MDYIEIALPLALLFLAFLLKLLIDRSADRPMLGAAILELPVDIIFLSISLIVAFTISNPSNIKEGLFSFVVYIIISIFVVFLWRRSVSAFESNQYILCPILAGINYLICGIGLSTAINIIQTRGQHV